MLTKSFLNHYNSILFTPIWLKFISFTKYLKILLNCIKQEKNNSYYFKRLLHTFLIILMEAIKRIQANKYK